MTRHLRAYCTALGIRPLDVAGTAYERGGRVLSYTAGIDAWHLSEWQPPHECPATGLELGGVTRLLSCHVTLQEGLAALAR